MKRLVLILIVVLILFGIMLACGLSIDRNDARASQEPSWMGLLDPMVKKAPVAVTEILAGPCFKHRSRRRCKSPKRVPKLRSFV